MSELLVLGDGIIGRTVAYYASRAGYSVTLVDHPKVGAATPAAAGMLTPAAEVETAEDALIQFAINSCQSYPEFIEELEEESGILCDYSTAGTLMLALHRDHLNQLNYLAAAQRAFGLEVTQLRRAEVLDLEPALSPGVVGALYAANNHHVNPPLVHAALGEALTRYGVRRYQAESLRLPWMDNQLNEISLITSQREHRLKPDFTVACGGAWVNEVLPQPLPARPVKGQYLRLKGPPLLKRVVRTPDVYLVPRRDGELYVGGTSEEKGFDTARTAGAAMDLLYHTWRALPGSYELELMEHGVGFRPALRDNLPAIGATPVDGLFVATGHYRHGIMLAPATAKLLLETLASGEDTPKNAPFSPRRFFSAPTLEVA